MRFVASTAWTLLALESVLVIVWTLFAVKNVGLETQERVMTVLFIGVAVTVIGLAGGLLLYGQAKQANIAIGLGFAVAALPTALLGGRWGFNKFNAFDRAQSRAQAGRFDDSALTEMARAMDRKEWDTLRQLFATNQPDWTARDRHGQTLLGHAIQHVMDNYLDKSDLEPIRILIDSGVRVGTNDLDSRTPFMLEVLSCGNAGSAELLDLVLRAGGDPNASDMHNEPLIHVMRGSLPKLQLLTRYGANPQALSRRDDRPGWTALMTAVATSDWEKASFFIEHGVDPEYRSPDGKTCRSLLLEASERAKATERNLGPAYLVFVQRLNQELP